MLHNRDWYLGCLDAMEANARDLGSKNEAACLVLIRYFIAEQASHLEVASSALRDACPLPLVPVVVCQEAQSAEWNEAAFQRDQEIAAWLNARVPASEQAPEKAEDVTP